MSVVLFSICVWFDCRRSLGGGRQLKAESIKSKCRHEQCGTNIALTSCLWKAVMCASNIISARKIMSTVCSKNVLGMNSKRHL